MLDSISFWHVPTWFWIIPYLWSNMILSVHTILFLILPLSCNQPSLQGALVPVIGEISSSLFHYAELETCVSVCLFLILNSYWYLLIPVRHHRPLPFFLCSIFALPFSSNETLVANDINIPTQFAQSFDKYRIASELLYQYQY